MWIANTKPQLRNYLSSGSEKIILVPTMGALHPGHASLIALAREHAGKDGIVIVSIFVNPIQFDRSSDLEKYPRPLAEDLEICEKYGADGVFAPEANEVYFPDRSITVTEKSLSENLCGATRPGHFDGVCTVVLKLFNLTKCTAAVFGEKDFQQLAIIRRMVRDLDLDVEIIPHPTIREPDGLAMSSRNTRLTPEHRADAVRIFKALSAARQFTSAFDIFAAAKSHIEASDHAKIDYLSLVDANTLTPAPDLSAPTILACAVFYGDVRLIDHISIPAHPQNS
ncbi:pantoate--beta-alanine ligase [Luteolibacter algae]|uniref:Pantothenate synthetase n=1 Tax=Luteolibacter algae TaxID=454151 RepID=A0ABW5D940_9BACT